MDVTPREVNEKQFRDAWRGYNQEEVDDFLDRIAETLENVERENQSLRDRNIELEQALATTREAEEMLKKTLVTAQRAAEEAIAKAKTKAEQLVIEAEQRARGANDEARKILDRAEAQANKRVLDIDRESRERRKDLDGEIARLSAYQSDLQRRLRAFLDEQRRALDELVNASPESEGGSLASARRDPSGRDVDAELASGDRIVHVDVPSEQESLVENGDAVAHRRGVRGLFFREEG